MKFSNYSLRKKLLLLLVPLSILYSIAVAYFFFDTSNSVIHSSTIEEERKNSTVLNQTIDDFATKALATAKIFAKNDNIPEAYSNPDEAAGSDFLANAVRPIINEITKDSEIKDFKIHYHKPPARSFLRVWNDKRLDDLAHFRPTILEVYRTKQPVKAIEFGVGGFAVRGLSPIIFEGEYLGSVEFLYSIKDILNLLSADKSKTDMINIITAETAENALSKEQIEQFYSLKIDDFYLSKPNSDWAIPSEILNDDIIKQMKNSDETIIHNYDDIFFSLNPLFDLNDRKIGYVASVKNNSEVIESQRKDLIIKVSLITVMIFLFVIAIIIMIDYFIIKPVREAANIAQQVSKGDFEFLKDM